MLFVTQAALILQQSQEGRYYVHYQNIAYGYHTTADLCQGHTRNGVVESPEQCDDNNATNTDACLNTCKNATCGDGFEQTGVEECDDGNAINTDACVNSCIDASCGDGLVQTGVEACDDGNNSNLDACLNTCVAASCGDGYLRTNIEECEGATDGCISCRIQGGNSTSTILEEEEEYELPAGKRAGPPPDCGNGIVDALKGEECDLGTAKNRTSSECTSICKKPRCANGKVEVGEECDPEDPKWKFEQNACGSKACTMPICDEFGECIGGCEILFPLCLKIRTLVPLNGQNTSPTPTLDDEGHGAAGSAPGSAMMTPVSSVPTGTIKPQKPDESPILDIDPTSSRQNLPGDLDSMSSPIEDISLCGNGLLDEENGEVCDDGNDIAGDGCTLCVFATCGNGYLEFGEECDEGRRNSDYVPDSCSSQCLLPRCGDGIVDTAFGELCDQGEFNSNTETNRCRLNCVHPRCGDGVRDPNEDCDDGNTFERDACSSSCTSFICGNGTLDWNEACDDGNKIDGDKCSSSCLLETQSFFDWFYQTIRSPFWEQNRQLMNKQIR